MAPLVLHVSRQLQLRALRTAVLERHGFEVILASSIAEVEEACQKNVFDLVLLGHSIPPPEKAVMLAVIRQTCKPQTPIVGLFSVASSEAEGADWVASAHDPEDLIKLLSRALGQDLPSQSVAD